MAKAPPLCSGHPACTPGPWPLGPHISVSQCQPIAAPPLPPWGWVHHPPPHRRSSPSTQGAPWGQSGGQKRSGSTCQVRFCLPRLGAAPVCCGSTAGADAHQPGVTGHSPHLWAQKRQSFPGRAGTHQNFRPQVSPREPGSRHQRLGQEAGPKSESLGQALVALTAATRGSSGAGRWDVTRPWGCPGGQAPAQGLAGQEGGVWCPLARRSSWAHRHPRPAYTLLSWAGFACLAGVGLRGGRVYGACAHAGR